MTANVPLFLFSSILTWSYDSEGRLTNVTFPTGVVTNLHGDMSSGAVAVDIETSGRDEDVSITTNLSSVDSFYTLVQGKVLIQVCVSVVVPAPKCTTQIIKCIFLWPMVKLSYFNFVFMTNCIVKNTI